MGDDVEYLTDLGDLQGHIGREHELDKFAWALRRHVLLLDPAAVGAMHVTCADEAACESIGSFQRCFVNAMLPDLKLAERAPFFISNLGGRYESGAIAIAEHHFATPDSHKSFKVMLIKLDSHVGVLGTGKDSAYGLMQRYEVESTACGALHALLVGDKRSFATDLRAAFRVRGVDRVPPLLDAAKVDPAFQSLAIAIVNARVQLRQLERDIALHTPNSPTLYVAVSCVTLNRVEQDTELLCGIHVADHVTSQKECSYVGLGDDASAYRFDYENGRLLVSDMQWPVPRQTRISLASEALIES